MSTRTARVERTSDGDLLGASIFLGDTDLEALGVDMEADEIEYSVEDGQVAVRPAPLEASPIP